MSIVETSTASDAADAFGKCNDGASAFRQEIDEDLSSRRCYRCLDIYLRMLHPSSFGTSRSTFSSATVITSVIAIVLCITIATSAGIVSTARNSRPWNIEILLNVSSSRFCTFDECIESKCNSDVAPFFCLVEDDVNVGGW